MYKKIYSKLKENKLNPYPIGGHRGECKEDYCVIKEGTQVPTINTNKLGYKRIDIILFIPIGSYIEVEDYAKEIRKAMQELKFLRKTGAETPIVVDDEKKAYTMSIEYQVMKKLEG
jgi:hypothetical protein